MTARSIALGCAAALCASLALLSACGRSGDPGAREPGPVRLVAGVPPMAGLLAELAPPGADVRAIVAPGSSPHTFEPGPADVAAIARADLVVLVGLGVEASLPVRSVPPQRRLEMAAALGIQSGHDDHDHDHAGHEHDHSGPDAHLWLDPVLVIEFVPALAGAVRDALQRAGADEAAMLEVDDRERALLERIRAVDASYGGRLAPYAGAAIITHHDAWSRPAERYGLEIAGVILQAEGVEPSPAHLARLVDLARERSVRAVLTEPQLDAAVARRLAEQIGLPLGTLDPLGSGDWEATMRANLDELVRVLDTDA